MSDIVDDLRIAAANADAASMSGNGGDLYREAAAEIERLRGDLKSAEDTAHAGYAQAFGMIENLKKRMEAQSKELAKAGELAIEAFTKQYGPDLAKAAVETIDSHHRQAVERANEAGTGG